MVYNSLTYKIEKKKKFLSRIWDYWAIFCIIVKNVKRNSKMYSSNGKKMYSSIVLGNSKKEKKKFFLKAQGPENFLVIISCKKPAFSLIFFFWGVRIPQKYFFLVEHSILHQMVYET